MAFFTKAVKSVKKAARATGKGVAAVGKVTGKVARSPLVRATATGVCLAVAPSMAKDVGPTLDMAAKVSDAAKSLDPKKKKAAKQLILNTAKQAKLGNPDAARALKLVATVAAAKKGDPVARKKVVTLAKIATTKKPIAVASKGAPKLPASKGKVVKRFELLDTGRMREA
jgi:hypothetical protein